VARPSAFAWPPRSAPASTGALRCSSKPSIGLHQRDNERPARHPVQTSRPARKHPASFGRHDEDHDPRLLTICRSTSAGGGVHGGHIWSEGRCRTCWRREDSINRVPILSGRRSIPTTAGKPPQRRQPRSSKPGASAGRNNLQDSISTFSPVVWFCITGRQRQRQEATLVNELRCIRAPGSTSSDLKVPFPPRLRSCAGIKSIRNKALIVDRSEPDSAARPAFPPGHLHRCLHLIRQVLPPTVEARPAATSGAIQFQRPKGDVAKPAQRPGE